VISDDPPIRKLPENNSLCLQFPLSRTRGAKPTLQGVVLEKLTCLSRCAVAISPPIQFRCVIRWRLDARLVTQVASR